MRRILPRPGDVMCVLKREQSCVIGYYVKKWEKNGPLVEFYECPFGWTSEAGLSGCRKLFGPVLVGINPPVREGRWSIIGFIPITGYEPPLFLMMGPPLWWVYDGSNERPVGGRLPKEYHELELLEVFSYQLIEERIRDGSTPFSYVGRMLAHGLEP